MKNQNVGKETAPIRVKHAYYTSMQTTQMDASGASLPLPKESTFRLFATWNMERPRTCIPSTEHVFINQNLRHSSTCFHSQIKEQLFTSWWWPTLQTVSCFLSIQVWKKIFEAMYVSTLLGLLISCFCCIATASVTPPHGNELEILSVNGIKASSGKFSARELSTISRTVLSPSSNRQTIAVSLKTKDKSPSRRHLLKMVQELLNMDFLNGFPRTCGPRFMNRGNKLYVILCKQEDNSK